MPVAIRKRSWEEHVTHASGLQYSYDDLDLVCSHGVDGEGVRMGVGASKQGRRTRCASMPEGCHQLPTEELEQKVEVTASVMNDDTESKEFKLMKSSIKVPLDLKEELVHGPRDSVDADIPQGASESEHLQSANIGNHGQSHWYSNCGMSVANISSATDGSGHSEKIINGEFDVSAESTQSHNVGNNDSVLKNPHITHEEKQCISISSNNGPPLSESEQSGKHPNNQETKESHTEGYSRPPEIFDATLNQSSLAGLQPQTDLPGVEKETIYTSSHADASVTLPVVGLSSRVDIMENCDVMSQASKAVEPVVTLIVEEVYKKGGAASWTEDSAGKMDGLNAPETLNENAGLKPHLKDIQVGEQDPHDCTGILGQARGSEISYQTLLEQHNVEMTAMSQGEECAADVKYEPITSPDNCFKGQCRSSTVEKLDNGYSEGKHIETNITHSVNQYLEMTAYVSQPHCEDQAISQQLQNSCSKLDTIPEASLIEPCDTPVPETQKNLIFTQSPDDQQSHMDGKKEATEQDTKNLPPCSAAVCNELSPEGLHSNQEASSSYFSESPGSEVADGQSELHRRAAMVSRVGAVYSDTQLASPVTDGTYVPGDQKEDNVVKVRMRKGEHARLDSMVLLLMKLDQLDQEIENALSATSSMDSTPTLHRRQLLEFDSGPLPAASQNPPNPPISSVSTSGPSPVLGAKPKSRSSVAAEDVPSNRGGRRLLTPDHLPLNVTVGNNILVTLSVERSHQTDPESPKELSY